MEWVYVVVLLTGSECEHNPGTTCVMSVHGFTDRQVAQDFMREQPDWAAPHFFAVRINEDASP